MAKVLLVSTVINKSLTKAVEDVEDCVDVKLVYSYSLYNYSVEEIQKLVDWADIVLIDVRGDPAILSNVNYGEKDVVVLVGGTTLMSKAKLGKFKMPAKAGTAIGSSETMKKRIEKMQKIIEGLGKVLPFGALKDGRDYVKLMKYWTNGGHENYKNMFLLIAKRFGADVNVDEPVEFPEHGIYHPTYGFDYKPVIDPNKPTVGVLFYGGMHFEQCLKTLDELIKRLNTNVIPVYTEGILGLRAVEEYFKEVDAIVSLLWFRLNGGPLGGDPRPTVELLKKRKTKLFTPALMYNQKIEDWERDERGLNVIQTITTVVLPEMDGGVEPIPICGVRNNEVVPIEDRVEKFTNRVNRWLELKRKPNSEKKIAIIVYNYPPG
ncbi:magnesium chelatase, partial [Archaeoglobales archaeon]